MSQRTIAVPAGAFSYAHDHGFKLMSNGIEFPYDDGPMTFTVPRPRDHAGGKVTVRLFFKCKPGPEGDHEFLVTAGHYNSGQEFGPGSTHSTPSMNLPGPAEIVYATSVDFPSGDGLSTGDWWYFKLNRDGLYRTNILMMSAGIDYNVTKPLLGVPSVPHKTPTTARKAPAKASKPAKKRR
jgi:hypothetical protein